MLQELEVQKLEVPKIIAGRVDHTILNGEGEGSLPLHPPAAADELIHYLLHKLLSI